jgi:hypothetical protein
MEEEITFRAVVEVLGKPKEHIVMALNGYLEKLENDENFSLLKKDLAEARQQENSELWATFAELELKTSEVKNLTSFCFDYMPSVLEIIYPKELKFKDSDVSQFLNDLQARLHQVDMVAKQVQTENNILNKSLGSLLKNYITLALTKQNLNSEQLSKLTGVAQDKLEDFLDQLIDDGRVDLKEGIYLLKKEVVA